MKSNYSFFYKISLGIHVILNSCLAIITNNNHVQSLKGRLHNDYYQPLEYCRNPLMNFDKIDEQVNIMVGYETSNPKDNIDIL